MQFVEKGIENEKTLMLIPGTCCNWETNFMRVIPELEKKYHLICVNYDGFDGSDAIFPDILILTGFFGDSYGKDRSIHQGKL